MKGPWSLTSCFSRTAYVGLLFRLTALARTTSASCMHPHTLHQISKQVIADHYFCLCGSHGKKRAKKSVWKLRKRFKGREDTLLVTYTRRCTVSAFDPAFSEEQWAAIARRPRTRSRFSSVRLVEGTDRILTHTKHAFDCGGNWSNRRKPTQTRREHANCTHKRPSSPGN